jgi:hypothetical protein
MCLTIGPAVAVAPQFGDALSNHAPHDSRVYAGVAVLRSSIPSVGPRKGQVRDRNLAS